MCAAIRCLPEPSARARSRATFSSRRRLAPIIKYHFLSCPGRSGPAGAGGGSAIQPRSARLFRSSISSTFNSYTLRNRLCFRLAGFARRIPPPIVLLPQPTSGPSQSEPPNALPRAAGAVFTRALRRSTVALHPRGPFCRVLNRAVHPSRSPPMSYRVNSTSSALTPSFAAQRCTSST